MFNQHINYNVNEVNKYVHEVNKYVHEVNEYVHEVNEYVHEIVFTIKTCTFIKQETILACKSGRNDPKITQGLSRIALGGPSEFV